MRFGLYVALLFAACAAGQAPASLPGTFGAGEPLPPPVAPARAGGGAAAEGVAGLSASDPGAEADFRDAKARFDADDRAGAGAALDTFAAHHAGSPLVPAVDLMRARLALLRGDARAAETLLAPLASAPPDPGVGAGARYYLGLAQVRLGQLAPARDLLLPFLPPAGAAGPGDDALVELRGALAEATAGLGDLPAALELWDAYARGARQPEQAYARARATALADALAPAAAARTYADSPERGLARAVLGGKAASYARAGGDAGGAAAIDADTAAARRSVGFEDAGVAGKPGGRGDPSRIGLALALSGRFQPVGEAALRAAFVATGAPAAPGVRLCVRDTGQEPDRAARSVAELARVDEVVGLVSAGDRRLVAPGLAAAADDGVPVLALDDTVPGAATAFQVVHAPEARVAALARAALALGARDFALVGPDSASGKRLRAALRREVTAAGARVTADVSYPPGATSFTATVAALKKKPPQVVFVGDGEDRLELIAPALAAADLWPAPWGAPRPPGTPGHPRPRNVLLLSTASDLGPRLLQSAGRYVQGTLLAPGFYADAGDPAARAFVDGYRAAYGQDPRTTEAYAFDGVNALRAALAGGARTRADVLRALAADTFAGLTGALRFGPDHARVDPPRLYVVDGDGIKLFH